MNFYSHADTVVGEYTAPNATEATSYTIIYDVVYNADGTITVNVTDWGGAPSDAANLLLHNEAGGEICGLVAMANNSATTPEISKDTKFKVSFYLPCDANTYGESPIRTPDSETLYTAPGKTTEGGESGEGNEGGDNTGDETTVTITEDMVTIDVVEPYNIDNTSAWTQCYTKIPNVLFSDITNVKYQLYVKSGEGEESLYWENTNVAFQLYEGTTARYFDQKQFTDLTAGTTYTYRYVVTLTPVNGDVIVKEGSKTFTTTGGTTTDPETPNAFDLTATAGTPTETAIPLSYTTANIPDGYTLSSVTWTNAADANHTGNFDLANSTATAPAEPGKTYTFNIVATASNGTETITATTTVTATTPAVITGDPSITTANNHAINVSSTTISAFIVFKVVNYNILNNGEGTVKCIVYVDGTQKNELTLQKGGAIENNTGNEYWLNAGDIATGLIPESSHEVKLVCQVPLTDGTTAEQEFINTVTTTAPAGFTFIGIGASDVTNTSANISWYAYLPEGYVLENFQITNWAVAADKISTEQTQWLITDYKTQNVVVDNLLPANEYLFQVGMNYYETEADKEAGTNKKWVQTDVRVTTTGEALPTFDLTVTASDVTYNSAVLTYAESNIPEGYALSSVKWTNAADANHTGSFDLETKTANLTGLADNTTYTFNVEATATKDGADDVVVKSTVEVQTPDNVTPSITTADNHKLTPGVDKIESLLVFNVANYDVNPEGTVKCVVYIDGKETNTLALAQGAAIDGGHEYWTNAPIVANGLVPETNYEVKLICQVPLADGTTAEEVFTETVTTTIPTELTLIGYPATEITNVSARLTWYDYLPEGYVYDKIVVTNINANVDNTQLDAATQWTIVDPENQSVVVDGLLPNNQYTFQVMLFYYESEADKAAGNVKSDKQADIIFTTDAGEVKEETYTAETEGVIYAGLVTEGDQDSADRHVWTEQYAGILTEGDAEKGVFNPTMYYKVQARQNGTVRITITLDQKSPYIFVPQIHTTDVSYTMLGTTTPKQLSNLYLPETAVTDLGAATAEEAATAAEEKGWETWTFTTTKQYEGSLSFYFNLSFNDGGSTRSGKVTLDEIPENPTEIEEVAVAEDEVKVYVSGGNIVAPEGAEIYNLNGVRVSGENATSGIYIVRVGDKAVKVLVK